MLKRAFLATFLSLNIIGTTPVAAAASAADGYVTGFVPLSNGIVFFFQNGTISGSHPACDTGGLPQRWALDSTTAAGQSLLSILLTAKSTHEILRIVGSGTCPTGGNSESIGILVTDDVQ